MAAPRAACEGLVGPAIKPLVLPTRTFELAVHTCDLATALGLPLEVPATAATQTLRLVSELAVGSGRAGPLLLAATGRSGLPPGYSVL